MAHSKGNRSTPSGPAKKVGAFFGKVGDVLKKTAETLKPFFKGIGTFFSKVGSVLKAVWLKLRPLFKKIGDFFVRLAKWASKKYASLSSEKQIIAAGCAVIVLSGLLFLVAVTVPKKVAEPDPPLTLELEMPDDDEFSETAYATGSAFTTATPAPAATPAPFVEPLSKGFDGPLVASVQSRLMVLGYMDDDEPTEHFGSLTKDALTTFQKHNGLPADGVLQEATYAVLFSPTAQTYVIQLGDSGEDVRDVQERLYELGYLGKDLITGTFAEKTEIAVKEFQHNNKLTEDGKVGTETIEALYSDGVVGNFFKKGETSDTVRIYQERLQELGYLSSGYKATGKMDNQTITAIKAFQDKNDLVADGCLGPTTMAKLDSSDAVSYALQFGMKGNNVKDLQTRLYKLGYLNKGQITGYYGEETEDAVKAFQHRNGLKEDGQVGSKTLSKLNSDSAVKAKVKTPTPKPTKKAKAESTKKSSKATSKTKVKATSKTKAKATAATKKATATPAKSASKADQLVSVAKTKLGCPYVRGKKGPDSFDCSGFVYWCLKQVGVSQSYLTSSGWRNVSKYTRYTSLSEARKGDVLVFSGTSDGAGHVGLCIGSGQMIDASSGAGQVRITSLSGNYWKVHFICGYHIW